MLARNDLIFNNKVTKPKLVAIKSKNLLLEVVGNNQIDVTKFKTEHKWIGMLQVYKIQMGIGRFIIKSFWQVRLSKNYFLDWWKRKNKVR